MPLITTVAEIKEVMRISNLDLDESIPDMEAAQDSRLRPFLGDEFLTVLQNAHDAPADTMPQPSALMLDLLKKTQKALAYFAYHDDLGSIHARLTDAGVRRNTTDNMPAAFRWEYEGLKEVLIEKAYQALEGLLRLLELNSEQEEVATWLASDAYKRRKKFLIKDPLDFDERFSLNQPFRTYHLLTGCMADVDKLWINGTIGKPFYDSLKELEGPDEDQAAVIDLLKDAFANLTIAHAFRKLPVRISDKGLTVMNGAADAKDADRTAATDSNILTVRNAAEADGRTYLAKAKALLNQKASTELFPLYFESGLYVAPNNEPYDRGNANHKMFRF